MIFTNQLDPSWKRGHPAPRKTGKISVQSSTVDPAYFDLSIGRAALPSNTNFWRPAAIATTEQGIAPEKKRNLSNRRGVEFLLPPYRVGRDSAFGSVGDVNRKSQSGSVVLPPGAPEILLPAARPFGRQQQQQQQEEGGWSRSVELLGFGARVLALSVHSKKRELLCDRKDPFLHLTPTKLAFTVLKSGCVVAAPMVNEAILENLDEDDTRLLGSSDRGLGAAGGRLFVGGMSVYVDSNHRLVFDRDEREEEEEEEEGDEGFDDVMKSLSKSFQQFPALTLRRVLHSVLTVSTQRLLEWQAVMRLSARTADRLTKRPAAPAPAVSAHVRATDHRFTPWSCRAVAEYFAVGVAQDRAHVSRNGRGEDDSHGRKESRVPEPGPVHRRRAVSLRPRVPSGEEPEEAKPLRVHGLGGYAARDAAEVDGQRRVRPRHLGGGHPWHRCRYFGLPRPRA
ncbi:unnamed protein product [Pylaiella littoralis]